MVCGVLRNCYEAFAFVLFLVLLWLPVLMKIGLWNYLRMQLEKRSVSNCSRKKMMKLNIHIH
ncbi:unnamed protein product [Musa acuminata var. zebrina]